MAASTDQIVALRAAPSPRESVISGESESLISSGTTATAPVAEQSCVSLVQIGGGVVPPGHFRCKSCKRVFANAEVSARPGTCKIDHASYKSLTTRWSKQRQLKCWWSSLDDSAKTQWFLKQQSLPGGTKRKFDEISYVDEAVSAVGQEDRSRDHMVPWTIFKRNCLLEGKLLPQIEREWQNRINDPAICAEFHRGQWHIPEYQGFYRDTFKTDTNASVVARKAVVNDADVLTQMRSSGSSLLAQYHQSFRGVQQRDATDIPRVDASMSDQPTAVPVDDVMARQIQREVTRQLMEQTEIGKTKK